MTLLQRVWRALGPRSETAWPADLVLTALRMAATLVWADTIRPLATFTITFSDGAAGLPAAFWPMEVRTRNVKVRMDDGMLVVEPADTEEVEMAGSPVPPSINVATETCGWEPELDEAVALWAAALLTMDSVPDAAASYVDAAEQRRQRVMAEWRNSREWRLRRGDA